MLEPMRSASTAPLFSIVTATFNSGSLLRRTAASLQAQSLDDFEWIIVDGASRDDTVRIIESYGDLVDQWISEPDEGISDAWNKGLARARGRYVLILNAGDTYDRTFLETIAPKCDGRRIVCANARLAVDDGTIIGEFRSQPHKLGRAMHLAHNWCAVPLQHYRDLGPYRRMPLAMDFDWFHRYYRRFGVEGFVVVGQSLGTYYLGGKSDDNYRESFRANERIIIENGGGALRARAVRYWYSFKHAVRRQLVRSRAK